MPKSGAGVRIWGWNIFLGLRGAEQVSLYPCRPLLPGMLVQWRALCFPFTVSKKLLVLLHPASTTWATQKFRAFEEKIVKYPSKTVLLVSCGSGTHRKTRAGPMPAYWSLWYAFQGADAAAASLRNSVRAKKGRVSQLQIASISILLTANRFS